MSDMHLSDTYILLFSGKPTDRFVVIDTETTGLDPEKDEVLSLAVVDQDGNELFNHYVRPTTRKRWPKAAEIHGIKWADVKDEKELLDYKDELDAIFSQYDFLVGYNLDFDTSMLRAGGYKVAIKNRFDLMDAYAEAYGKWNERHGDYAWMRLTQCAYRYGYKFKAHDALNDAKATAYCYKRFVDECREAKDAKGNEYWTRREERLKRESEEIATTKSGGGKAALVIAVAVIAVIVIVALLIK